MDTRARRQGAVLLLALTVLALVTAAVLSVVQRPDTPTPLEAERVVLVGVPGLAWSQVDAQMPTLQRWAQEGAAGNLVVRGARLVTCDADGWLTLGAGQRAAAAGPSPSDPEGCWSDYRPQTGAEGAPPGGAVVPELGVWQEGADGRPLDARLGTLAETLGGAGTPEGTEGADEPCVLMAHGPLAALGAAGPDGVVAAYRPGTLTDRAAPSGCMLDLVDSGPSATPAEVDAALARWEADLPDAHPRRRRWSGRQPGRGSCRHPSGRGARDRVDAISWAAGLVHDTPAGSGADRRPDRDAPGRPRP